MPFFQLRFSAPHPTFGHVRQFGFVVEATHYPKNMDNLNSHLHVLRIRSSSFASVSSLHKVCYIGAVHVSVGMDEKCDISNLSHSIVSRNMREQQNLRKQAQLLGQSDSTTSITDEERKRRKKIGLANKGRVPWNKGRKHSAETCERIKQHTIEALKDPKVRKKMSQHSRSHSAESKAKMSASLRRIWGRRLKWKRAREKLFFSWAESIADAAKTGGSEQQELNWDSYENIRETLYLQQLQQAAEKKKAREVKKRRAKEAARRAKEKKKATLAYERKKDSETNKDEEESTIQSRRKVKQRSRELDREPSTNGQVSSRRDIVTSQLHISALEKLDIELIKREKMRAEVSFADQIRAAKNRKMELAMAASSVPAANQKPQMHTLLHSQ